jgi:hypothetical protein
MFDARCFDMRTTLSIDDDVLDAAKQVAVAQSVSIGEVISELARRGLSAPTEAPAVTRNGIRLSRSDRTAAR